MAGPCAAPGARRPPPRHARRALLALLALRCCGWLPAPVLLGHPGPARGRAPAGLRARLGRRPVLRARAARAPSELVGGLLAAIEGTDRGLAASDAQREEIDRLISELEAAGAGQDFFADGRALGTYEVAYVGVASSRIANPAGGRWRGRIGRLLFPTRGLYQHLLPAEPGPGGGGGDAGADVLAVNAVEVALLGVLPACVVLRGPARRLDAEARRRVTDERRTPGGLTPNAVRAEFEAPRLAAGPRGRGPLGLGRWLPTLRLRAGPRTSVVLDAPYVDERIRIGKGASGTRFVFVRTEAAGAEVWRWVVARTPIGAKAAGRAALASGALAGAVALCGSVPRAPWLAGSLVLVLLGAACLLSSGGIVERTPAKPDYVGQGSSPVGG